MGYTTYEFYIKKYHGKSIPDTDFDKWNDRASDKLDFLTDGNITDDALADERLNAKIQKSTCALMEVLKQIEDETEKTSGEGTGIVKSMSSGNESVSYERAETVITKVLTDKKAQSRLLYETVQEYLAGTGLLYLGC